MSTTIDGDPGKLSGDADYAIARLEWRVNLSDVDCRSMAYEYRVAMSAYEKHDGPYPSEDLIDAHDEYKKRFGGTPHVEFLKKNKIPGAGARKKAQAAKRSNHRSTYS